MRSDLLPKPLWTELEPLLPPHPPSPRGGRPRVSDRACLAALVYVLREGCTYRGLPCRELGCGSGVTVWRRLQEWTHANVWPAVHERLLAHLGRAGQVDVDTVVADIASVRAVKGGVHTGPNPTDRGKKGCKRHILTDATGLPLVVRTGRANENDEARRPDLLRWRPPVPNAKGRPRRVRTVLADAAYGVGWLITRVVGWGYRALLKPRGKAGRVHGSGLGRRRYVVERTMAWAANDRRLRVCDERTWCSGQGFHELSACVCCAKQVANMQKDKKPSAHRF